MADRLDRLRELFPEVFCEGKIDLRQAATNAWPRDRYGPGAVRLELGGKGDAIRCIQTPSVGTFVPCPKESVNFDTTENLFIEGDNLEVLKLLQKSYYGKVKMIYIDPPYNTGNEFIYPDNFQEGLAEYLRYSGQVNEEGVKQSTNSETSGRYHSKWLDMMYPRLFLARNLLREDGVIFVSIDDHEVHNLRLLMDEIFGGENFVATVIWQKVYPPKAVRDTSPKITITSLFMHEIGRGRKLTRVTRNASTFGGAESTIYRNPDNDPEGCGGPLISLHATTTDEGDYTLRYKCHWRGGLLRGLHQDRTVRISEEKFRELQCG